MTTSSSYLDRVLQTVRHAPGPLSVPEIAEAVQCAPVTVRRHLLVLKEEGTVRCLGIRPRRGEDGSRRAGRGHFEYAPAQTLAAR